MAEPQVKEGSPSTPGETLRHWLDGLRAANCLPPLAEAIELGRQVCLVVDEARRRGTPYGDIRPETIVLMPQPNAPFGYRPVLTGPSQGDVAPQGRFAYLSPEQAIGDATDARSDVYSLGVLLYELTVGRPPFEPQTFAEAIRCHTREQPLAPSSLRADLPEPLESTILTALAKAPAARFADAGALAGALAGLQSGALALEQAPPETAPPPVPPAEPTGDRLIIITPDGAVRTMPGRRGPMRIGCSSDNEIVLDYVGIEPHHARLLFEEGMCRVERTGEGEVSLGGNTLMPGAPKAWSSEQVLCIGPVRLRLEPAASPTFRRPAEPAPLVEPPTQAALPRPGWRVPPWVIPLGAAAFLGLLGILLWTVVLPPPVIHSLAIDPPVAVAGQPITIRWSLDNAQSVAIEPLTGPLDPATGQYTIATGLAEGQSLAFVARNRFRSVRQTLAVPVVTPTQPAATVQPSATARPTSQPPRQATAKPTPLPTRPPTAMATKAPSYTPTTCPPPGARFSAANARWRSQIGCPIAAAVDTWMAVQRFEHGWMFWSKHLAEIYVLIATSSGTKWVRYTDTWIEGKPDRDPSLTPPPGLQQPIRGFGQVWREQLGGPRSAIGWAVEPEQGYDGGHQQYSTGLLLAGPGGQVFVLFADGHWEGP